MDGLEQDLDILLIWFQNISVWTTCLLESQNPKMGLHRFRSAHDIFFSHGTVKHLLHIETEHACSLESPSNMLKQALECRTVAFDTVYLEKVPNQELRSIHGDKKARVTQFLYE